MTSLGAYLNANWHDFRIIGLFEGEPSVTGGSPHLKGQLHGYLIFSLTLTFTIFWRSSRATGYLGLRGAHVTLPFTNDLFCSITPGEAHIMGMSWSSAVSLIVFCRIYYVFPQSIRMVSPDCLSISNHYQLDYIPNRRDKLTIKKTLKLHGILAHYEGNPHATSGSSTQRNNNAESVSMPRRHHESNPLPWRHNERVSVSNHELPVRDCLLNRSFKARIKENIKAPCHWPLWGEFTGHRWIPLTKGQ